MKIEFPNRDKLIDFELYLSQKNLLHNYDSNYRFNTFEKTDMTHEYISIAHKFGGKVINEK